MSDFIENKWISLKKIFALSVKHEPSYFQKIRERNFLSLF